MATTSQQKALALFEGLLASGAYSDLTLTCGQAVHKVHKAIVCGRAGFFERAIKFGGQESETGNIDLPEDEPETVERLLHFLYGGEYDPVLPAYAHVRATRPATNQYGGSYTYNFPHSCDSLIHWKDPRECVCPHHNCADYLSNGCFEKKVNFTCEVCNTALMPDSDADQLLIHAKMYEMGDKYDVGGLKDLAKEKFDRACKHFWNKPEFAIAANHAFSTTVEDDMGLRDIVIATISGHIELVNDPAVSVLLTQFNGLALGILQAKIKEHGWDKKNSS